MSYWLFKSEPDCFSFADLCAAPERTTGWDGVRNFQARNFLRDQIKVGDGVLYYHSSADPPAIAGLAEVVEAAHPDPTAFDPSADHYDPKSRPESPTWYQVKIRAVRAIEPPLGLPKLREVAALAKMELLRKGSRLSIQPVRPDEWEVVLALAKVGVFKTTRDCEALPPSSVGGNGTRRGRTGSG
jgi:predicted RNA-binding protein with PUA-like domain